MLWEQNKKIGMKKRPGLFIGTSGWHYGHWKGPFYPPELPATDFLAFYAERFLTAEINSTFYHLPAAQAFVTWRDAVGRGFVFAVKGSRYITHMKKLKDAGQAVSRFMGLAEHLGEKLGPVLFQLPPRWRVDASRLAGFLARLPPGPRCAFEFRDPSWFTPEIYGLLESRGAAFCVYDLGGFETPREVTADFVYVRLHGPGAAYQGSYADGQLAAWAEALSSWLDRGRDVYCYFNNDQAGYAVADALRLRSLLAGREGEPSGTRHPGG